MDNLKSTQIVVCLDIGDGECSAFSLRRQGDSFAKDEGALYLADNVFRIPSVMYYDSEGNVTIGDLTVEDGCTCVSNFKKSPPNENFLGWDETCWPIGNGTTFRQCMFDFIHKLWKNILFFNSGDGGVFKGKTTPKDMETVALFVGCPASENWLAEAQMTKYKNLISEATGLKSVFVIPESTASAFGAVVNNKSIKYLDGVAVFDFGSSTADFTYMHGDERRTCSWTLGASAIEETMYRLIYEDAGFDLRDEDFPYRKTQRRNTFEIRVKAKEKFFLPYGEETRTRKQEFAVRELNRFIDIDDKFMERVLNTPLQNPVWEDGDPQKSNGKKSWKQHCKDFLTRCNNVIVQDKLPVDRIVLAGGASNMHFIEELCYDIFGKTPDRNLLPYNSVSGGLCRLAQNAYLLHKIIDEECERIQVSPTWEQAVDICDQIRTKLDKLIKARVSDFIKIYPNMTCTYEELKEKANKYMNGKLNNNVFEEEVELKIRKLKRFITDQYTDVAKNGSKLMYERDDFVKHGIFKYVEAMGQLPHQKTNYNFWQDSNVGIFTPWMSALGDVLRLKFYTTEKDMVNTSACGQKYIEILNFSSVITQIMSEMNLPYVDKANKYNKNNGMLQLEKNFKEQIILDIRKILISVALLDESLCLIDKCDEDNRHDDINTKSYSSWTWHDGVDDAIGYNQSFY